MEAFNIPAFVRRRRKISQDKSTTSRVSRSSIASLGWAIATMRATWVAYSASCSPGSKGAGAIPATRLKESSPDESGERGRQMSYSCSQPKKERGSGVKGPRAIREQVCIVHSGHSARASLFTNFRRFGCLEQPNLGQKLGGDLGIRRAATSCL